MSIEKSLALFSIVCSLISWIALFVYVKNQKKGK